MGTPDGTAVGRTYTTGRRQPYLIRKWPGSDWVLPMGPYTITQLAVLVGSVYLLFSYRGLWAHFGAFNVVLGVGIPVALTYATRHTRVEGRDPLRAGVALAGLLLRPGGGYLNGAPVHPGRRGRLGGYHLPVSPLPAALAPSPAPGAAGGGHTPAADRGSPRWVTELVGQAARATRERPR